MAISPNVPWQYGQQAVGGGSVPAWVGRSGQIAPFDPKNARRDIAAGNVLDTVRFPTGTSTELPPDEKRCCCLGNDAAGRPVREIAMRGNPTAMQALKKANSFKRRVRALRDQGGMTSIWQRWLNPEPIPSLSRGETVVLKWENGVTVSVDPSTTV